MSDDSLDTAHPGVRLVLAYLRALETDPAEALLASFLAPDVQQREFFDAF